MWDGEVEGEGCDLHQPLSAKNTGILLVLLLEDPVGITEFQVRDLEQRFRTFWDWSDQLIWTTQCAFSLYLFWDLFASSVWEESGDLRGWAGRPRDKVGCVHHMLDYSTQGSTVESWKRQYEVKQINALPNSCYEACFLSFDLFNFVGLHFKEYFPEQQNS